MSSQRPGRSAPSRSAPERSPDLPAAAERGRRRAQSSRRIALAALVVAVLAIGLGAWRVIVPPGSPCQSVAWNVAPAAADLPAGWTIAGIQYDVDRKLMTVIGPAPATQTASQPLVYATVTCYAQDAADAVTRSGAAATAAGEQVTLRPDLGEQGFASVGSSGTAFIEFRHGNVVASIAASGGATAAEAGTVASAVDRAMGGTGAGSAASVSASGVGAVSSRASTAPSASASGGASPSPAAPELEAALPKKVGAATLTIQSATGTTILGTDQGSRAIAAALRAAGKTAADLRVAQAFDVSSTVDLQILAFSVTGMSLDSVRSLVLDSWLVASGAGVKRDSVTLAGHAFTRIDYGDKGIQDYVLATADRVIIIETADANLASAAAAALP